MPQRYERLGLRVSNDYLDPLILDVSFSGCDLSSKEKEAIKTMVRSKSALGAVSHLEAAGWEEYHSSITDYIVLRRPVVDPSITPAAGD